MGFVSSLLGIANKVGGIANKFVNNAGVIGKIAGGVSKAANLVSTIVPKISPVVNAITTGAKLAYQSGLADRLTGLLLLLCLAALRAAHFMLAFAARRSCLLCMRLRFVLRTCSAFAPLAFFLMRDFAHNVRLINISDPKGDLFELWAYFLVSRLVF